MAELPDINGIAEEAPSEKAPTPQPTQQPTAQPSTQQAGCTGNCMNCHPYQRAYCAAQIGYNTQELIASLVTGIDEMRGEISKLSAVLGELQQERQKKAEQPELPLFEPAAPQPTSRSRKRKGQEA